MNQILKYSLTFLLGLVSAWGSVVRAQPGTPDLPAVLYPASDTSRPLLVYLSGDGGWNHFSTAFLQSLHSRGYAIVAFNSRNYFWRKKTAEQTARDINGLASRYLGEWKRSRFILIGYSFGADVAPFVVTRMEPALQERLVHLVLMSPSPKTDFEVHVSGLLGFSGGSGDSVPAETNKIRKPILLVFGDNENEFPLGQLTIKNYSQIRLPGGHHYDGDPAGVATAIFKQLP
ncbi:MAG TPA: AcvB/VirJ family lysyl-phosphatidylglycerol hydrolase [Chitinophagaceae bacterium]|nr:AcvB/VirJ family lysyl-phosphatidylglycerol hydrolase [Chitinophagaceae bacterium]